MHFGCAAVFLRRGLPKDTGPSWESQKWGFSDFDRNIRPMEGGPALLELPLVHEHFFRNSSLLAELWSFVTDLGVTILFPPRAPLPHFESYWAVLGSISSLLGP